MTLGPGIAKTILPKGFFASGINCGVRRYRPDLGIVISEHDAVAAGVFTQNQCKAAPVLYCQQLLPSTRIRAIITNSGQANAATGLAGDEDNLKMVQATAQAVNCEPSQVLSASTGVIGQRLAIENIVAAIPELTDRVTETAEGFALAIMTTDLVPKCAFSEVELSGGRVRITGICKGSGMIHPNMATMLGYMLTDAKLAPEFANSLLKEATDLSFNMISVDGDSSTNDTVFLMANGASQVELNSEDDHRQFKAAFIEVAKQLAQSIASDGEGASKLIEVTVKNAPSLDLARRAARGVTVSPLVKTAMHGEDPNWGRILARLGAEQVPEATLHKLDLFVQGHKLFSAGQPVDFNRPEVVVSLKRAKIHIEIDLKSGSAEAVAWGCDLSKGYISINAEYTT